MSATNKIGFDYETMHEMGEQWESPEDIIYYIRGGLLFLNKTNESTDTDIIEKRNRWISLMTQAIACIEIVK